MIDLELGSKWKVFKELMSIGDRDPKLVANARKLLQEVDKKVGLDAIKRMEPGAAARARAKYLLSNPLEVVFEDLTWQPGVEGLYVAAAFVMWDIYARYGFPWER